jgi:hypothetical protein
MTHGCSLHHPGKFSVDLALFQNTLLYKLFLKSMLKDVFPTIFGERMKEKKHTPILLINLFYSEAELAGS